MDKYINNNKEFYWGDWYFKDHVMAPDFNYKAHKKELSPYYQECGFKVSMMFDDYYSRLNGVHSDKYLPMDVYYFFVIPALNRHDFITPYLDKNIYSELFPGVKQPVSVVKNIHGHFYHDGQEITKDEAVSLVAGSDAEMIIKPTVETCNGDGVEGISNKNKECLIALFDRYSINFIVQEKVVQHPDIQRVNPTSLNTMRLYTYRRLDGSYHFLYPFAALRFGDKGAIRDNLSKGGGCCLIDANGVVDDRVCRYMNMEVFSLKQLTGVENLVIPNYAVVVDTLLKLHRRLPYFDYIGWDITVLPDGEPLLIEYNLAPAIEIPQMLCGPMFGEYLDEVIERASHVECTRVQTNKKVFDRDSYFYLHMQ